ncbi:MAG: hypothetical protein E6K83_08715 [Thaumarchaeota archaeon]|nr:MAG: hypothetical protein E6K83_08715 [Nitrososphaerota archaeon]
MTEYFDEEGLLKVIKIFELSGAITKLNWSWNDRPDPVKTVHELMDKGQKLFLEISEYEQRIGPKINVQQRKSIGDAIEDLGKLIPYMKDKIKPYEITTHQNKF